MLKAVGRKVWRSVVAVVHDPDVQRSAKQLAVLAVVRLAAALGASAWLVEHLK